MPNNISASAQATLLNPVHFFVFSLEDNSAPGVSIESIAPPQPYGNPIEVTFTYNCINGHLYTVKVWESVDTTPTGVVRCSYSRSVANNLINLRASIYAEVDVTPNWVSAASTIVDSTFDGWDIDALTSNPYYLVRDTEPDNTQAEYSFSVDTITLLLGRTLQPNEQWRVDFKAQVIAADNGVPSSPFGDGRMITADETLTATDKNKALLLRSATSQLSIGLPLLAALQDFTDIVYLMSNGGSHINANIFTQGTDKIQYKGSVSNIYLGQVEMGSFFKAFTYYWPMQDIVGMRQVGELIYNYNTDVINTLQCDGSSLVRADYPRLWAYIQTLSEGVVNEATWNAFTTIDTITVYPNRCNFSTGNGSTTFRVPLLTNMILKAAGTRNAGSFEMDQLISFKVEETVGGLSPNLFGVSTHTRIKGRYNGTDTGLTDLSGLAKNLDGTDMARIGDENKVRNAAAYCLIRI